MMQGSARTALRWRRGAARACVLPAVCCNGPRSLCCCCHGFKGC
jgi:hypothetical protein